VKAGKAVSAERKKWQAKGKALPVETVTVATQTDHIQEPTVVQVDDGTQTELEKGKGRAKDSEDTVMKYGSDNSDTYREMYEDLSGYEDEDEALVAAPLATTKKQAAPRSAAKPAGKRSRPAKTPHRSTSPDDNGPLVKAMVIHGVPCQRPMADMIQDVGVKGIMGARWLLGGMRRLGKATSSVVVFFDRKLALGSHLKVRDAGYRLKPMTSTEEGGGWNAVTGDGRLLMLAYVSRPYYSDWFFLFLYSGWMDLGLAQFVCS